ncbi:glycerol dehydratase [Salmonella enterica subsp. enterica]|nr:glycerol dehydratase [Salmonella enterica subsp. enterica]
MRYIAGIDIGNSSTEVALARQDETGALTITHSALAETTGIKGTLRNVFGIQEALALVAKRAGSMSAIFRSSALTKPRR